VRPKASGAGLVCRTDQYFQCQRLTYTCRDLLQTRAETYVHTFCETRSCHTLIVIMISKDTETFQVLFTVSPFCAWNITTVEINSDVHLLKS